jgi:hypothetical protein
MALSGARKIIQAGAGLLMLAAVILVGHEVAVAQASRCDPEAEACALDFGEPAFAAITSASSAHRWRLEVGSAGQFRVILAHPNASYRIALWGPGGAALEWSPGVQQAYMVVDVNVSEPGRCTVQIDSPTAETDETPYLLVALWTNERSSGQERSTQFGGPTLPDLLPAVANPRSQPSARVLAPPRAQGPPDAPTDLTAMPLESLQIRLSWTDNSINETGFRISGDAGYMATVEVNNPAYLTEPLGSGRTRCYRVQAFNDYGNSPWTERACGTTRTLPNLGEPRLGPASPPVVLLPPPPVPPRPPQGLRASPVSHQIIRLDWTDRSDNEDGFMIDGTGGFHLLGANRTTANVGGLLPLTSYCFRVGAYNDAGQSWSNEACAATTADPRAQAP